MQASQTITSSTLVASGSDNNWAARPTQAISEETVPDFWAFGSRALDTSYPVAAEDFESHSPKPSQNLVYHTDERRTGDLVDRDLYGLDNAPAAATASTIPVAAPIFKQCARCLTVYTDEENGDHSCNILHAAPMDVWIKGGKAMYPAHYFACCGRYRLAIPGLQLQRPFNPICRMEPHVPFVD